MEERDFLFMYSLFQRHRDFPDVALIASALRVRGGKKEHHFTHCETDNGKGLH